MTPMHVQRDERHLADQLGVLRRRWRTVIAAVAGFMIVAAIVNLRLPPIYQATSRIVIGAGSMRGLLSDGMTPLEGYFLERRSFETQLEVIQSEPVAVRAAEALGWIDATSSPEQRQSRARAVKAAVSVQHLRDTRIVLLRASDSSPVRAQALANAVAHAYIAFAEEEGAEARRRSVTWLTEEIDALRAKLRDSEERIVDYLTSEELELAVAESATPRTASAADETIRGRLAAAELELSGLMGRYRTLHPKVQEARQRVASLRERVARQHETNVDDSRKLIQYRLLRRDAELDQQMYEVLLKKLKEADVSGGFSEPHIRILEEASRPGAPVAPRMVRNLGVAAVLALCLGLGLGYLVEYFDRSIGSSEDVQRAIGLPTLGVVTLFARTRRASSGLAVETAGAGIDEMFRTLRTNLRFSHVDLPRRIVLVTSTGPEEGKSTVVANLGASLAQSGRRTLLVDTDMRRPALHRVLGLARGTGLADVLAGDVELDSAVRSTRIPGLDVLLAGTVPANPAELIESARAQALIASLRSRYDYVLLDSPPAAGLVDATLLSVIADGVLFVVEPRRFDLRLLRSALRQLDRAGARLYGVVLNKAPRFHGAELYGYYAERQETRASAAGAA